MKYLVQSFLFLVASFSVHQSAFAQELVTPIYASVTLENQEFVTPTKVEKITNTDAIHELAHQIRKVVDFPFEEGTFRNKLQVMVELEVDQNGNVKNTRVHNTPNKVLKDSILESLSKLEKVKPIVLNGRKVSKTLFVPLTFQF